MEYQSTCTKKNDIQNQWNVSLHQLFSAFGETEIWPRWKKSFKNFLMSKKCTLWHFSYFFFIKSIPTERPNLVRPHWTKLMWRLERPQKSCWALSCGNLKSMDSVAPGRWQTFGVTYWLGVAFRHSEKVFQSAEASKWRHHHSGSFASYAWKINSGDSTGVAVCLWQVVLSACIVS